MFNLLILLNWPRFAACRNKSPIFHAVLLSSQSLPIRPYFYAFTIPLLSLSTILVYLILCLSAKCVNKTTAPAAYMPQITLWKFVLYERASWLSFNFWLANSSLAYLWQYLVNTDITIRFPLSVLLAGTAPRRLTSSTCQGSSDASPSLHLTASLTASYATIIYSSDGQTFLGAGQKKKKKILAGRNDLL